METMTVIDFMNELMKQINENRFLLPHRRGTYVLSDPILPPRNVAGFIKTQLNQFVKELEAANETNQHSTEDP